MVAASARTIFAQPSALACQAKLHEVIGILERRCPKAAAFLDGARIDALTHTALPRGHWRKIASTNNVVKLTGTDIKRRSSVSGSSPTTPQRSVPSAPSGWISLTTGPWPNAATCQETPLWLSTAPEEINPTNAA
jgi:transposase-like protein